MQKAERHRVDQLPKSDLGCCFLASRTEVSRKESDATQTAFRKFLSSKGSLLRLSSMSPCIVRPQGAKAANFAGHIFERPRAPVNWLTEASIANDAVIKPKLVEFM
jgi:hypothetical protein